MTRCSGLCQGETFLPVTQAGNQRTVLPDAEAAEKPHALHWYGWYCVVYSLQVWYDLVRPPANNRDSPHMCRRSRQVAHHQALWGRPYRYCMLRLEAARTGPKGDTCPIHMWSHNLLSACSTVPSPTPQGDPGACRKAATSCPAHLSVYMKVTWETQAEPRHWMHAHTGPRHHVYHNYVHIVTMFVTPAEYSAAWAAGASCSVCAVAARCTLA